MRCQTCDGGGYVTIERREGRFVAVPDDDEPLVPCPTCGGCGIASCCDGMVEVE